ncbi:methylthioribose-1-phosphate isomerase, partial [Phenoliferia sp. Uapishka_3]
MAVVGLTAFRVAGGESTPAGFEAAGSIEIIDQLQLPHSIRWEAVATIDEAFDAIKTMKIRGAPAIASLAALGIASELLLLLAHKPSASFPVSSLATPTAFLSVLLSRTAYLLTSRPTAVNLLEALTRIEVEANRSVGDGQNAEQVARRVVDVAVGVWSEDKERNKRIGDNGAAWILAKLEGEGTIKKGEKICVLTVCNTGSLATSGYGTALGVIASLQEQGRLEHAYYAQTGPYQQGARLTSMELASLGTNNTMVCDTAIGALIAEKRVHLFVAGADRIAANGDTANKISTYQISLLCSSPHPFSPNPPIPVLIAAPITTLDLAMDSGRSIVIEQRPSWEACTVRGRVVDVDAMARSGGLLPESDGKEIDVQTVLVTPPNTRAWNPAFDVTPASLIAGIVTEVGVAKKVASGEYDLKSFVAKGGN